MLHDNLKAILPVTNVCEINIECIMGGGGGVMTQFRIQSQRSPVNLEIKRHIAINSTDTTSLDDPADEKEYNKENNRI